MRRIIIGDVHGCDRALRNLLDRVWPGPEDQLILLGDLFDRGGESWEVFQTVRQLAADFGERFILLRGNHEDYLLQPGLTFLQRMAWERVGRGASRKSFRRQKLYRNTTPEMRLFGVRYLPCHFLPMLSKSVRNMQALRHIKD